MVDPASASEDEGDLVAIVLDWVILVDWHDTNIRGIRVVSIQIVSLFFIMFSSHDLRCR